MSVVSAAETLVGTYFDVNFPDYVPDDRVVFRAFVDDGGLRGTFDAAEEIESWLHLDLSDDAFLNFYLHKGGNCGPYDSHQREYLRDVRVYVLTYADQKIRRAQAENPHLPPGYVRDVLMSTHQGQEWLRSIPDRLQTARELWSLTLSAPYPLSADYLVPGTTVAGEPVVLRLARGGQPPEREMAFLRACAGEGAVRVLDEAPHLGMVLLERAVPGRPLSAMVEHDDERATDVIATVLETLWREVPADQVTSNELGAWRRPFARLDPTSSDFGCYLDRFAYRKLIPADLVTDAHRVMDELNASAPRKVLLHGDLHHDNIVSSDRWPSGWLAIDPKGLHGDPGYDVAAMLYNPLPWVGQVADLEGLLRGRIGQLAARLRLDEERLKAWAFVKAVLAEAWFVEDTGTTHGVPLRVATTLRRML